jgi:hypothetical protein
MRAVVCAHGRSHREGRADGVRGPGPRATRAYPSSRGERLVVRDGGRGRTGGVLGRALAGQADRYSPPCLQGPDLPGPSAVARARRSDSLLSVVRCSAIVDGVRPTSRSLSASPASCDVPETALAQDQTSAPSHLIQGGCLFPSVTGQARHVTVMERSLTGQSMLGAAFCTSCARPTVHRTDASAPHRASGPAVGSHGEDGSLRVASWVAVVVPKYRSPVKQRARAILLFTVSED